MVNVVRNNSFVFDRSKIASGILSTTSSTLPDDSYTISFAYRDLNSHTATGVTLPYMAYDAGTLAPNITSLTANGTLIDGSTFAYTLPEAPYGGTVKLTFSNGTTTTVIPLPNARSGTFTYDRARYAASIPTGIYTVTLSYQDTAGNTVNSTSVTGVSVTVAPLTATTDTDGDGLNDLAELKLAALGFDWQVAQPELVTAFLNDASLYTLVEYDANRTAGHDDVTASPTTYGLYTSAEIAASRTAGQTDVTSAPATYNLVTAAAAQAQADAARLTGRADVTASPATYGLYTSAEIAASRTAGQTDVTSAPATYNLVTATDAQAQADAARLTGRADVTASPTTYGLYTSAEIAASRTAGQTDVTSAPATFNLVTAAAAQAQADAARLTGREDVTASPATYGLFTSAQIDASRSAGRADVTSDPIAYELYRPTDLQALAPGAPVITHDPVTKKFKLTLHVEKSTDLSQFSPLPFSVDTTSINPSGELEFEFTVDEPAAFFRLQAR